MRVLPFRKFPSEETLKNQLLQIEAFRGRETLIHQVAEAFGDRILTSEGIRGGISILTFRFKGTLPAEKEELRDLLVKSLEQMSLFHCASLR